MTRPSPEQLRNLDLLELCDRCEISLHEAKRLKIEQRAEDNIARLDDEILGRILLDLLFLMGKR